MLRALLTISAVQTLPFGIAAVLTPDKVFEQFGVTLDTAGELIARGYGASLIGFGITLWGLRSSQSTASQRYVCAGLSCFNAIEAFIQLEAGMRGTAQPVIFGNVALNGVLSLASVALLIRNARQVNAD